MTLLTDLPTSVVSLCGLRLFNKEEKTIFFIEHDSVTMKWKDTFIVYD